MKSSLSAQPVSIAKEVGDRAGEGGAHGNLGNVYQCLGDIQRAREYHKQHLSIAKEIGDRAGQECADANLGNAYDWLGNFQRAINGHKKCLSFAKDVRDRTLEGTASGNLGNDYRYLDNFQRAIGGFHVTSSPPCWWTVNKRPLIGSFCLSTSICSLHLCYLCLPRLHENHL